MTIKPGENKNNKRTPYDAYNKKRVRLCEFSVTATQAEIVAPALQRLADHYGGKVPAISQAILDSDKRLKNKLKIYEYSEANSSSDATYAVYELGPMNFDLLWDDDGDQNYDGQNQELIEAVEKYGIFTSYVARQDAS